MVLRWCWGGVEGVLRWCWGGVEEVLGWCWGGVGVVLRSLPVVGSPNIVGFAF